MSIYLLARIRLLSGLVVLNPPVSVRDNQECPLASGRTTLPAAVAVGRTLAVLRLLTACLAARAAAQVVGQVSLLLAPAQAVRVMTAEPVVLEQAHAAAVAVAQEPQAVRQAQTEATEVLVCPPALLALP